MLNTTSTGRRHRWLSALVLALLIGTFLLRGLREAQENTNSAAFDQRSYLFLGMNLRDGRDLTDGKRHPALPALLSLIAERDWPYYTRAKLMNLGLGVVCVLLTYGIGRRWFGRRVGLLAAAMLCLNPPFVHVSARVMAEPLLLAFTLISWYWMTQSLASQGRRALLYGAGAGLTAGLAYFTKGTALQMVPSFLLVAIWLYRKAVVRQRHVWLFMAAWLVAWMPLLLFNLQAYGNPLYNYNYKHEIFLDSPADRHFADISEAPTLQTYLRDHTVADMAFRMGFGIKEVTRITFRALAPFDPDRLIGGPAEVAWILTWLALLGFLAWRWRRIALGLGTVWPSAYMLFGSMLVASLIPLGWFVQASNVSPRFIVVFTPLLYILLFGALRAWVQSWPAAAPRARAGAVANGALSLMVIASLGLGARDLPHLSADPIRVDREANARPQAVLEWIASGTPYGTRVLWGPSYTLPNWIYVRHVSFKDVPSSARTWEAVEAFARDGKLVYALLDWEMVSRRPGSFDPYFSISYPWVIIHHLPPNWALMLPYDGIPANWVVMRLLDAVPAQQPLKAQFGDQVALIGAETYQPPERPDQVYVSVYLRALRTPEHELGVRVQLVAASGAVVAEGEAPLLEGRYPVSLWEPGASLGHRQRLHLPASDNAATFRVVVWLYRLDTGKPLPGQGAALAQMEGGLALPEPLTVLPTTAPAP
jgi:4-amino-4-deoxy-L-arabinose transferase-like glycosyltransferase